MNSAPHSDPQVLDYTMFKDAPVPRPLHRVEYRRKGETAAADCGAQGVVWGSFAFPPRFPGALCGGCYPAGLSGQRA
jgi:hypothetical protein